MPRLWKGTKILVLCLKKPFVPKPLAPVIVGLKKLVLPYAVVPIGAVPASTASEQPSASESKS